ncbi:glycosyltransferase family 4 protein [Winogradskyella echinorum]|uniref:Glycosyltransferase family 4 protein n=1 Tax=Winogradskyella echinorum TaxID=538189 RepID=A0ABR6Y0F2_9FLAO|nr:glycosyltransferase family 4 protein [Winogradskyella echinorum]MBC3846216.1 glycosyltransferase family 4 protein [Winogradskyella echinorum]MBC5750564.1 glycosyltransferase family 4 protein [Winogradskyella echinorum]
MKKIIRITTVPVSLGTLLKGQLKFMSKHYEVIGVSSEGDALKEVNHNEGIKTIPVNMTRTITPFKDLKALFQLYRVFKKEKPQIVHTHTPKAGTVGMLAARLAGVPHRLHTIAGMPLLEATGMKRKILNLVEKITYSGATLVLPNSFAMKDIIIEEKFCSEKKLRVIGNGSSNGIDTDHYDVKKVPLESIESLKQQLNITPQDVVFLFIGRVVKDKGINELVEAFNTISQSRSNAKLIIVGGKEAELDPIAPATEAIIASNNNIHETGAVKDIRPYVAVSDVLAFPSYREGFPNVVLQASCMEKPCIVTDINGCNEIISNNYNGLIIPPKDSEALRKAMMTLYDNPNKIKELAVNARPNIINKYKRELIWKELLELYNNLN